MDEIARAALSSKYHFQRMFHALTGFTVSEYIRNRRLTLAAEELTGTTAKVIDIALKYGYDSPEAFTKAFQRVHGVTPLAARRENVRLKAFPRISFQLQIKGETEMNYRLVQEEETKAIGKEVILEKEHAREIPAFVEKIWTDGTHNRINEAVGRPHGSLLNGYHFDFAEDGSKRYMMGYPVPVGTEVPGDLTVLAIPAQTYAVFDSRETIPEDSEIGLEIINVWRRIYAEWFPSTNFEQAEGPCLEKYRWLDEAKSESVCEVWIPVRRKE
ncbi:AraC family transcriptional regulator [Paenibacillus sp. NFR01]|nr:AraC family transcriptional regulator [Paenibacillus sp. NFR01]